jgi:hypothetical protein
MGDQEVLAKGWWALLAGASAAALYFGLSGLVGRVPRLGGLVLLLGMPAMVLHGADGLAGYAELPLAVSLMFGGLFLYRWLRSSGPGEFGLSALFFGMTGFIKNEGLVTALVGLGLLILLAWLRRRDAKAPLVPALLAAALMVVPWQIQRSLHGITGDLNPTLGGLLEHFPERGGTVLLHMAWYAGDVSLLSLAWPTLPVLSLAVLLLLPRRWLTALPLLLLIIAHLGGMAAAFITTPHDLKWHLGTAGDRLVFQPTLLAVLLGTIYAGMLLEERAAKVEKTAHDEPAGTGQRALITVT